MLFHQAGSLFSPKEEDFRDTWFLPRRDLHSAFGEIYAHLFKYQCKIGGNRENYRKLMEDYKERLKKALVCLDESLSDY